MWTVTVNTFVYTFWATLIKMIGGLGLALTMNQDFIVNQLEQSLEDALESLAHGGPGTLDVHADAAEAIQVRDKGPR